MKRERFEAITSRYASLRVAVLGDFCLDRYLEIDPALAEVSIETGLPVHNVVRVRPQPGAAGTILNNLVALGIGTIYPIGIAGVDGEGFELVRALTTLPGVKLDYFLQTEARRTFTYCKPLIVAPGKAPVELNRLDSKNWSPTPLEVEARLREALDTASGKIDSLMVLDQVEAPETGVVTSTVRARLGEVAREKPGLVILADSRRGLADFPAVGFKMNAAELRAMTGAREIALDQDAVAAAAAGLARRTGRPVFVTLAELGMIGALPDGTVEHVPSLPVCGEIDIVGAGDAVSANLVASLGAGATLREAMELAGAGASVVIHKLGTTGTASVAEVGQRLMAGG